MTGRPTEFTQAMADLICERLADGQSLRTVCKSDDTPAMSTVFKWLREQESYSEQYTRATAERAEAMVEDMQAISDDKQIDHNHKRIMVDTRKWIASKLKPKKYGERVSLTGDDDGAPIIVTWATGDKV